MTDNDDGKQPRRNPWGQGQEQPKGRGPWDKGDKPSQGSDGPDFEALLRQAKSAFGSRGGGDGRMLVWAALIALVVWLGSGAFGVGPGEHAVIKRFGAIARTQTQPGLGYHLPWPVESVTKLNVMMDRRTQVGLTDSGYNRNQKNDVADESLMLTADANIVDIDVVVLWNITEARDYLFNIRNPEITVKRVAESAIREAVGQTNLQTIITEGRDEVAVRIIKLMQSILDSYKSGVSIKQVLIQEATVHPDVLEAYNDVAASRQDAERYQNEANIYRNDIIPKARGEAIRMTQDAAAYKQDVIARASGDSQRFAKILKAYQSGQDVTRSSYYIDTMEQVLQNSKRMIIDQKEGGQGVVPVLPLDTIRSVTPLQNNTP